MDERAISAMVEAYNQHVVSLGIPDYQTRYRAARFAPDRPATDAQLSSLQAHLQIPMPADLVRFYKVFGGLGPLPEDSGFQNSIIRLYAPARLLEALNAADPLHRCRSLGLMDMLRFHWGDREDFDAYLPEQVQWAANRRFQCVGWYSLFAFGEEFYYLFHDEGGTFGAIRYHQDEIDCLMEDLDCLLRGDGPVPEVRGAYHPLVHPTLSLQTLMQKAFLQMKEAICPDA